MSKKRSIHELLEEQESNSKKKMWEKIESRMDAVLDADPIPRKKFSWKKFCSVAASFAAVLGITLFSVFYFKPQSEAPSVPEEPQNRYCSQEDYTIQQNTETIKEYSVKNNKKLLYLDWYDHADLLENYVFVLNDTDEVICYNENIMNGETGDFVKIYITDNRTEIDLLQNIIEVSYYIEEIKDLSIKYGSNYLYAYSIFEYQEHRYYLELEQPMTENSILEIVEEMLP